MDEPDKYSRATGRSLAEWVDLLRAEHPDIEGYEHREIARSAVALGASEWWAQGIAVDFERMIGRRRVGETSTGRISVSASKTMPGEWSTAFEEVVEFLRTSPAALPAELDDAPRISETDKWRYWKAKFVDGTTAAINCSDVSKDGTPKVRFAVEHSGLGDLESRAPLKEHWRSVFTAFTQERSTD